MPYSVPAAADDTTAPRHHRRSSSSSSSSRFSNEITGPGAFTPMNNLPRRKSVNATTTRPMFQFHHDSSESDHDDDQDSDSRGQAPHTPRLTVDTLKPSQSGSIPFPTRGPVSPQPSVSPLPSPLPRTPSASSTSSAPILLANGKLLRPSLKSSLSSPHLLPAATPNVPLHLRSQSAPSTPNLSPDSEEPTPVHTPKNVHFKEDGGLETVRVFNKAGKPASISKSKEDETETETEGYDSSSNFNPDARFPFPSFPTAPPSSSATPEPRPRALTLAAPPLTSTIPPLPPPYAHTPLTPPHILVSSLVLTRTPPYSLKGTLLVLNIAYEKRVAVRFTLDDWCTTSEVIAAYDSPGLLPPSWARRCGVASTDPSYDTFTFSISLHDLYLSNTLPTRILFLAAKYTVPGAGEWWDNNRGDNFRVGFQAAPARVYRPALVGRSMSSPAAAGRGAAEGRVPTLGSLGLASALPRRPARPKPADADDEDAVPLASISRGTGFSNFNLPAFARAPPSPPTSPYSSTKLTLRNYASPTRERDKHAEEKSEKDATSPLPTPPVSRSSSLTDMHAANMRGLGLGMVNGHPATVPATPPKDSYAALLARWCFHTSSDVHAQETEKEKGPVLGTGARWESLGMA